MSEFHAHLDDYDTPRDEPHNTSGLAIASLVCSLIICCPLITLLGPILGVAAIAKIGTPPRQRGKGMAIAGIIIGTLFTIIGAIGVFYGGKWVADYSRFLTDGPQEAMQAAAAGDLDGFRAQFHGPGAAASDEQVQAFLDELEDRYGSFVSARFDEGAGQTPPFGATVFSLPYILEFSDETVTAEVELHLMDEATRQQIQKLGYILIDDPEHEDLRFPPLQ